MSTKHKSPSRRRLAQVYTEAAERIERKYSFGCCNAIFMACGCNDDLTDMALAPFMAKMGQQDSGKYWWGLFDEQTPRIIALLLMAELAKDGQLD